MPEKSEAVQLPNKNYLLDEFANHFFLYGLGACLISPNVSFVTGELICAYWLLNITLQIATCRTSSIILWVYMLHHKVT